MNASGKGGITIMQYSCESKQFYSIWANFTTRRLLHYGPINIWKPFNFNKNYEQKQKPG
jgi:hypothetical protein